MPQSGWGRTTLNVAPDWRLLGFTFAASLITRGLLRVAPALKSTKPDLVQSLKEDSPGAAGPARLSLTNTLVVMQVALSLVLLIGTGLFVRSLGQLHDI